VGRDFALRKRTVRLDGGEKITATVPFYEGANLIPTTTTEEMAALVLKASGTSGSCASYVIGIFDKLRAMGIDDPAVTALRLALKSL
jgi:cation transport regulator ChaC